MKHQRGSPGSCRILVVTGTDTGAGKTVLTGLLLAYLRRHGVEALAMKPFSSGNRDDARLLRDIGDRELSMEEVNPFHFRRPLAPLVAARLENRVVRMEEAIRRIRENSRKCERLLVEGAGGLLAPLGEGFGLLDLIRRLRAEVVVAAGNKLGVINHTLLTLRLLREIPRCHPRVALMATGPSDPSVRTNEQVLMECTAPVDVVSIPRLQGNLQSPAVVGLRATQFAEHLACLLGEDRLRRQEVAP